MSTPSLGVGYKIAMMIHARCKPCLCLFNKNTKDAEGNPVAPTHLSPMLTGDRNLDVSGDFPVPAGVCMCDEDCLFFSFFFALGGVEQGMDAYREGERGLFSYVVFVLFASQKGGLWVVFGLRYVTRFLGAVGSPTTCLELLPVFRCPSLHVFVRSLKCCCRQLDNIFENFPF